MVVWLCQSLLGQRVGVPVFFILIVFETFLLELVRFRYPIYCVFAFNLFSFPTFTYFDFVFILKYESENNIEVIPTDFNPKLFVCSLKLPGACVHGVWFRSWKAARQE